MSCFTGAFSPDYLFLSVNIVAFSTFDHLTVSVVPGPYDLGLGVCLAVSTTNSSVAVFLLSFFSLACPGGTGSRAGLPVLMDAVLP